MGACAFTGTQNGVFKNSHSGERFRKDAFSVDYRRKNLVSNKNGYLRTVHRASKRKGTKEWVLQSWTNHLPFLFLPNAKNGSTVFFFRNGMSMWKNLSGAKRCLQKLRIIYRTNLSFYRGRNWIVWCCYNKHVLTQQHHSCALKLTLHAQTQLSVKVL